MYRYPPPDPMEMKRYSNEPPGYKRPRYPVGPRYPQEPRYPGPPPYVDNGANRGQYPAQNVPRNIPQNRQRRQEETRVPQSYRYPTMSTPQDNSKDRGNDDSLPSYSYNYPAPYKEPHNTYNYDNTRNVIPIQRARSRNMPDPQGMYEPNNPTYQPVKQSDIERIERIDDDDDSDSDLPSPPNSRPGSARSSSRRKARSSQGSQSNRMGTGSKSPTNRSANGDSKKAMIYHIDGDPNRNYVSQVPDIGSQSQDDLETMKRANSLQSISSRASRSTVALAKRKKRLAAVTAHSSQRFTQQQRKQLAAFSSINYAPTHSHVYKDWLRRHPIKISWDRWILMILIGLAIGLMSALLKQCLTALANIKWDKTKELANDLDLTLCFAWTAGISVIFVVISSILVAFIHPPAGGSGVPEVLSYLNGVVVHGTMSLKTLIVKFISLILTVSSGLPQGIQGPIIALGAIVGLGIGQFKSKTLGISPKWFGRFRTPEERQNFMTAGVAAGVAAAFNAPIGGLLFAQEDLSSFWNNRLAWQTFFGCGIATVIANMFDSAFKGFQFNGNFGLLTASTPDPIPLNIVSLVPAIAVGIAGGILGALFTHANTVCVKLRKKIIGAIPHPIAQKFARVLETVIICMFMAAAVVWLPSAFSCTAKNSYNQTETGGCGFGSEFPVEPYTCCTDMNNCTEYSEAATIFYAQGLEMWSMLTAKGVHRKFGYVTLGSIFPVYYFAVVWTAGSAVAGGTFTPILVAGSLYGRIIGLGVLDIYTHISGAGIPASKYWEWIDPGFMAVLGSGCLLAGITRKQLAVTVIVVEMSQDIDIICPLLLGVFVAKMIADFFSKPLYKYQLEAKALPYLDSEITVVVNGEIANLELYTAKDIMTSPVKHIHVTETIANLARLLVETEHGGFPVLRYDEATKQQHLYGLITRTELYVILCDNQVYNEEETDIVIAPNIDYEELSIDYFPDQSLARERVKTYSRFERYKHIYIDLDKFINVSAPKVDQHYSLKRTYSLFRTLGLRHLMVTDLNNRCVGMITRKDLMPFHVKECLKNVYAEEDSLTENKGPVMAHVVNETNPPESPSTSTHGTDLAEKQNGVNLQSSSL